MRTLNTIEIDVPRSKLIDSLKKSKEKFKEEHAKALEEWSELVGKYIDKCKALLSEGKLGQRDLYLNAHKPEDKAGEYDKIIGFFEASSDDTITITKEQYDCIENDEWDWRLQHRALLASNNTELMNYR